MTFKDRIVALFLWLSGWSHHIRCFILRNDIMDITHKQRHTLHTGANRLIHPCKYILTPPVRCSQQLSVLNWISNLLISKISLQISKMALLFKNYWLVEVTYLLIRFKLTRFYFQAMQVGEEVKPGLLNQWVMFLMSILILLFTKSYFSSLFLRHFSRAYGLHARNMLPHLLKKRRRRARTGGLTVPQLIEGVTGMRGCPFSDGGLLFLHKKCN